MNFDSGVQRSVCVCRVVVVAYFVFVVIFFLYIRASHGTKTDVRARSMHTEQPPNNSGHFAIILLRYFVVVNVVVAMAGCVLVVVCSKAKDRKRNPK